MTDDVTPPGGADTASEPLNASDDAVLAEIAAMLEVVDPVPAELVQNVQFALALDQVFDEVAQIVRTPVDALATRSDLADATRTETLTFSSDRLTAMVTVSEVRRGHVRIDGWITPAGARTVDVRMQGADVSVESDPDGRFVLDDLRAGFVQLVFHPLGPDDGGLVVTPLFKV